MQACFSGRGPSNIRRTGFICALQPRVKFAKTLLLYYILIISQGRIKECFPLSSHIL